MHDISKSRSDETRPLTGVFYTRSPARPNPLGLHPVAVREIDGTRMKIGPIEAFDGTPVVDIKVSVYACGWMTGFRILQFAIARMHVGYEALLMNDFPAQRRKLLALFRRQSCT